MGRIGSAGQLKSFAGQIWPAGRQLKIAALIVPFIEIFSWHPRWGLKFAGIKSCWVSSNFGEMILVSGTPWCYFLMKFTIFKVIYSLN